jgi:hypothetical protein
VVGDHELRASLAGSGEEVARSRDAAGDLRDVFRAENLETHWPVVGIGIDL